MCIMKKIMGILIVGATAHFFSPSFMRLPVAPDAQSVFLATLNSSLCIDQGFVSVPLYNHLGADPVS